MTSDDVIVVIDAAGNVRHLSDDQLDGKLDVGSVNARRVSHVEPEPDGSGWYVDFGPIGGALYRGFQSRKAALEFEIRTLSEQALPRQLSPLT